MFQFQPPVSMPHVGEIQDRRHAHAFSVSAMQMHAAIQDMHYHVGTGMLRMHWKDSAHRICSTRSKCCVQAAVTCAAHTFMHMQERDCCSRCMHA